VVVHYKILKVEGCMRISKTTFDKPRVLMQTRRMTVAKEICVLNIVTRSGPRA
jgi:hypothetical protein